MTSVLDTTAFSAAMRGEKEMVRFLSSRGPGDVATVPPVVAEIEFGIERTDVESRKRSLLAGARDRLMSVIQVLPWTPRASTLFGIMKAALENEGTPIDDFDVAIAAIASAHGAEVITANLVHFTRIKGLSVRHWSDGSGEATVNP